MTDEEIARLLRPRHDWLKVAGFALAAAGAAWGIARWAATTPTREEFDKLSDKLVRVQLDQAAMKGDMQGIRESTQRIEENMRGIKVRVDELPSRRK